MHSVALTRQCVYGKVVYGTTEYSGTFTVAQNPQYRPALTCTGYWGRRRKFYCSQLTRSSKVVIWQIDSRNIRLLYSSFQAMI